MLTSEEELAEIEWVAGLIPMPPHLVRQGTKICRYTRQIRLLKLPQAGVIDPDAPPYLIQEGVDYIIEPIEPFTETYVWGVKVEET